MKYAFFGSPDFAAIILEKLIQADLPPALVVCNPDRPSGRKQIITPPATKIIAQTYKTPVSQPEVLDSRILDSSYDFAIVAAYAKILPKEVMDIPRLGTIGVHPSLLPKYRGATPIQSALLAGETETGATLFLLDAKVDHGKIVSSIKYQVSKNETYESLHDKLAELSAALLIKTLPEFVGGGIKPRSQNEAAATYTKKFTTQDAFVDLAKDDPISVERKIRALNPEPGVWTMQNEKRVKLIEAELVDGKLKLRTIQVAGKSPTAA